LIQKGTPAAAALRLGDVILDVNGQAPDSQSQVHDMIQCSLGRPTTLTVKRDGRVIQVVVIPRVNPPAGQGAVGFAGTITYSGTDAGGALIKTLQEPVTFVASIASLFQQRACSPPAGVTGPVNLLPLPALDGGRILFVLAGAARRRRIDPRLEGLIHFFGFALLMVFTLAVSAHDIGQWISGH
jgi:regulator of sigma E protease